MALGVPRAVLHFLQLFLSDRLQLLLSVFSFSEAREQPLWVVYWNPHGGYVRMLIPGARSGAVNKSIPECTCSQLRLTEATCCCLLSALLLETSILPAVCVVPCFSHFCAVC